MASYVSKILLNKSKLKSIANVCKFKNANLNEIFSGITRLELNKKIISYRKSVLAQ